MYCVTHSKIQTCTKDNHDMQSSDVQFTSSKYLKDLLFKDSLKWLTVMFNFTLCNQLYSTVFLCCFPKLS